MEIIHQMLRSLAKVDDSLWSELISRKMTNDDK